MNETNEVINIDKNTLSDKVDSLPIKGEDGELYKKCNEHNKEAINNIDIKPNYKRNKNSNL